MLQGKATWIPGDVVEAVKDYIHEEDTSLVPALRRALDIPFPSKNLIEETRPPKYDVTDLNVGEHKVIPWRSGSDQRPILRAIDRQAEQLGRNFNTTSDYDGIKVTRVI